MTKPRAAGRGVVVPVRQLEHATGLPLPAYQSAGASGLDLTAAVPEGAPMTIAPMTRALVPTGLVLELPPGTEAQVRPRSGLALRHGLTVLNSPGTIDSDYRGEVQVLLINLGEAQVVITRGERIAQLVVATLSRVQIIAVEKLGASRRGAGGFGSTGTAARQSPHDPVKKSGPMKKSRKVSPRDSGRKGVARSAAKRSQRQR